MFASQGYVYLIPVAYPLGLEYLSRVTCDLGGRGEEGGDVKAIMGGHFITQVDTASLWCHLAKRDAPPPGAYNVVQSFEKNLKPCMAKPRTEAARRKHNSFMSAASRFAEPADIVTKKPENENPGPGAYDSQRHAAKGGLMITRDKRFRHDMEDFPGPGTYEPSTTIARSKFLACYIRRPGQHRYNPTKTNGTLFDYCGDSGQEEMQRSTVIVDDHKEKRSVRCL
ncbi:sperm-tail PG-rich repeat-containing protein 2-like [Elysia marginata]|uniref:Sperm-tail PG-rich repeat-containing protein 2-like n=1 Tax=Elysia marginata TaxID=1093978 RepID=A0AAV4GFS8_9GAST|nr:sperm-tail PG-rich repeat-containing protein 2-like [Elysia marginata]